MVDWLTAGLEYWEAARSGVAWRRDFMVAVTRQAAHRPTIGPTRNNADDEVPDLLWCSRDGPHPGSGYARGGQSCASGLPGGHRRGRVRVGRWAGRAARKDRGGRWRGHRRPE